MADTKITSLLTPQVTTNPATDVLPIVNIADTSMATSGSTRKITVNQLLGAGGTATLASATITGDLTVRTNKLAVTSTGVGAGTATPLYPLHLVGEFGLEEASPAGTGSKLRFIGDATKYNFRIGKQLTANNSFEITPSTAAGGTTFSNPVYTVSYDGIHTFGDGAGGTRMTLNSTGLGVGVASPLYKLHVNGTDTTNVLFNGVTKGVRFAASASKFSITGVDNTGSATFQPLAIGGASLEFQIASTTQMTLDASANLLVGTTSSNGSISNASYVIGGIFSTLNGILLSVATATPTTLFAAPSESTLMVTASVNGASPSDYKVVAVVKRGGAAVAITTISSATSITITASGTNIQVTQTSGGTQNVYFNVIRLA